MQREALASDTADRNPAVTVAPRVVATDDFADVPVTIIKPSHSLFDIGLRSLWAYRELLYYLVWRTIKVRYKQTAIGLLWVVIQPLMTMVIFTFVFGHIAKLPTNGVPYPLFVYAGLLPWNLFVTGLTGASLSVVSNGGMISKVYFPRLLIPLAGVIGGLVDFFVSFLIFMGMIAYYQYPLRKALITLPFFIGLAVVSALAIGLWLSILNVRYRDIQYAVPFIAQLWLFLTPVAYASSLIPAKWRMLIGLNPMTSVVDGFRWVFVAEPRPFDGTFFLSIGVVLLLFLGGVLYFRRTEKTFADLI